MSHCPINGHSFCRKIEILQKFNYFSEIDEILLAQCKLYTITSCSCLMNWNHEHEIMDNLRTYLLIAIEFTGIICSIGGLFIFHSVATAWNFIWNMKYGNLVCIGVARNNFIVQRRYAGGWPRPHPFDAKKRGITLFSAVSVVYFLKPH